MHHCLLFFILLGENVCVKDNGGCSHICLATLDNEPDCLCPQLIRLDEDKKTCDNQNS